MKLILTILILLIPFIGFGQDIPLKETKVTTVRMDNKDRKKYNKSLAVYPQDQIGYIMNPISCPFGINYFRFFTKSIGWYVDIRSDLNVFAPGEWALRNEYWITVEMDANPTGIIEKAGGRDIFNFGFALHIIKSRRSATVLYSGYGVGVIKYFEKFDATYTGPYYAKNSSEIFGNLNFGILRQSNISDKYSSVSWLLGYDSAITGINLGVGITIP